MSFQPKFTITDRMTAGNVMKLGASEQMELISKSLKHGTIRAYKGAF